MYWSLALPGSMHLNNITYIQHLNNNSNEVECTGSYVPFNPVSDSLFRGVDVPTISNYILFKAFTNE